MKLSKNMFASFVAVAALVATADAAIAGKPVVTEAGTPPESAVPNPNAAQPCPTGEAMTTNSATGKQECAKSDAARAGVMPSLGGLRNTGTAQPPSNGTTSIRTDDRGPFTLTAPAGTPPPASQSNPK